MSHPSHEFESAGRKLVIKALAPVEGDLQFLNKRLIEYIPKDHSHTETILKDLFFSGGKRVRPALFFMSCRLLGYKGDHYFPVGAVSEYVHTASLLHDDVLDNSHTRRNRPTTNSIYGDLTSVLVGDLIYSTASVLMAETGYCELGAVFAKAIQAMSYGELIQLDHLYNPHMKSETYLEILSSKTAKLLGASCEAAGVLSESSPEIRKALYSFGHSVGLSFQLLDDALDYMQDSEALGKPAASDLLAGKVTYPLIKLMELASPQDKQFLVQTIPHLGQDPGPFQKILDLVAAYDTVSHTLRYAETFTEHALQSLSCFKDGPEKQDLVRLAEYLLVRPS